MDENDQPKQWVERITVLSYGQNNQGHTPTKTHRYTHIQWKCTATILIITVINKVVDHHLVVVFLPRLGLRLWKAMVLVMAVVTAITTTTTVITTERNVHAHQDR